MTQTHAAFFFVKSTRKNFLFTSRPYASNEFFLNPIHSIILLHFTNPHIMSSILKKKIEKHIHPLTQNPFTNLQLFYVEDKKTIIQKIRKEVTYHVLAYGFFCVCLCCVSH